MPSRSRFSRPPDSFGGLPTISEIYTKDAGSPPSFTLNMHPGSLYWFHGCLDEPVLRAVEEHSAAPLSPTMSGAQNRMSRSITGRRTHELPTRTCIFTDYDRRAGRTVAEVMAMTRLSQRSIQDADPHLQRYAMSVQGTTPWPDADARVVEMNQPWPERPCYAIAYAIQVDLWRFSSIYGDGSYCVTNVEVLEEVAGERADIARSTPAGVMKRAHREWKRTRDQVKETRREAKVQENMRGGTQSQPPVTGRSPSIHSAMLGRIIGRVMRAGNDSRSTGQQGKGHASQKHKKSRGVVEPVRSESGPKATQLGGKDSTHKSEDKSRSSRKAKKSSTSSRG